MKANSGKLCCRGEGMFQVRGFAQTNSPGPRLDMPSWAYRHRLLKKAGSCGVANQPQTDRLEKIRRCELRIV